MGLFLAKEQGAERSRAGGIGGRGFRARGCRAGGLPCLGGQDRFQLVIDTESDFGEQSKDLCTTEKMGASSPTNTQEQDCKLDEILFSVSKPGHSISGGTEKQGMS